MTTVRVLQQENNSIVLSLSYNPIHIMLVYNKEPTGINAKVDTRQTQAIIATRWKGESYVLIYDTNLFRPTLTR